MSQWIEVSIQTTHEAADLVAEIMRAAGANNGVVIEDPVVAYYVIIDEPHVKDQAHSTYATEFSSKVMKRVLP